MVKIEYRGIIRWISFLAVMLIGLLYLNSAAFSFWASWGPPTEYPKAWEHRALLHLGFSAALISTAIMLFVGLKKTFQW